MTHRTMSERSYHGATSRSSHSIKNDMRWWWIVVPKAAVITTTDPLGLPRSQDIQRSNQLRDLLYN